MPPITNVDHLYELAQEIKDASVLALSSSGVDVPTRQFIAPGLEVADEVWDNDCNQLAVHLLRLFSGSPDEELGFVEQKGYAISALYAVRITRCLQSVPEGDEAANPDALNSDSQVLYRDAWVLRQNLLDQYHVQKTFLQSCQSALIGPLEPFGPNGGVAGWVLSIGVQVLGY